MLIPLLIGVSPTSALPRSFKVFAFANNVMSYFKVGIVVNFQSCVFF